MLLQFLKQPPIGTIAGAVVPAGVLQLTGVDLIGMGSDLLLDLLGVSDRSGD